MLQINLSLLFDAWSGSGQAGCLEWWLLLWMDMRQIPMAVTEGTGSVGMAH